MVIPAETVSEIVKRMLEHKAGLAARDAETIMQMGHRWQQLEGALEANMQLLATNMVEAEAAGETIARTTLFENRRYQKLIAQLADELASYNAWAADFIAENQRNLARLGLEHSAEVISTSLAEGGQVGIYFDRLPISAVETMIGTTAQGAPVQSLLSQAYPMAVDQMTETLIRNTLLGVNPRQTAREMMDGVASDSLNHSLTVARTEQNRVYREATRQQYEKSGMVLQYRRLCAKNTETCAVCLSLDGEWYMTEDVMHVHPNDRCTMVPGVEGPDGEYIEPIEWETGTEWLRKQDPEVRQKILGKEMSDRWDAGLGGVEGADVNLSDFVAVKVDHPVWGPSLQRKPFKDLPHAALPTPTPTPPGLPTKPVDLSPVGITPADPSQIIAKMPGEEFMLRGEDINDVTIIKGTKSDVVDKISEMSGVDYDDTNRIIRSWAETANDHNPNALRIQQRAAEIFGGEVSLWQEGLVDIIGENMEEVLWSDDVIDAVLRSVYENTQDELREAGLKQVVLYRGMNVEQSLKIGTIFPLEMNALESWSTDFFTAKSFGDVVVEISVPAERVFSTGRTGLGCLFEKEFIVNNVSGGIVDKGKISWTN